MRFNFYQNLLKMKQKFKKERTLIVFRFYLCALIFGFSWVGWGGELLISDANFYAIEGEI